MKGIIRFSLNNKFAVWLITLIITVAGLYSGLNMKLETIPSITTPLVSVTTIYPGATPEQVAESISEPMEKKVKSIEGVIVVSSSSFQNASNIQIEFDFSKDMDKAEEEVQKAVSSLTLPEGVQEPNVSRLSFNAFPVMSLSISNSEQSLAELTKEVEENILPSLEGVEGVSSIQISGQQVKEVQLTFDQEKLKELGLSEQTVKQMIQGSDITMPLGLYTFDEMQKSVVIDGNIVTFENLKELKIPVVPSAPSQPMGAGPGSTIPQAGAQPPASNQPTTIPTIELSEIATIELVGESKSISRTNGETSIGVQIIKSADANTVDVVNAVKEMNTELQEDIDGLTMTPIFDQGKPIEESVNTMLSKALFGALFAMLIILLFLRNFRTTIISVISIPLSLLIAVLILKQMDITLNIMTLGAMTVAIGRVVDDSIVVIENIFRRMSLKDEKLTGRELILDATREMFMPIMSSTIVTIAVFLPLGLVKGTIGELFLPFALTIVFSLLASLLVAITIVPMLSHALFKKGLPHKHEEDKPRKLESAYNSLLTWTLNHKIITSLIAVGMLVGSLFLVPIIGVSFLPADEEKMVVATYKPLPGQTLEEVEEIATKAEEMLQARKDVETIQFSLGSENPMNPGQTNQAMFFISYDPETEEFSTEKEQVIKDLQALNEKGEWASQDFSGAGASNGLSMQIFGEDMTDIEPVVEDILAIMEQQDSLTKVESSISDTYEEYTLVANQEQLSELGLSAAQIGMALSNFNQREILTTVTKDEEDINVYLEVEAEKYSDINEMLDKTITSPLGKAVKIKDVIELNEGSTSDTVKRRDGQIFASVSGVITTKDVAKVSQDLQAEVDKLKLPANVEVTMGGVTEDIQESFTQLGLAMLAAIAIVYLILVITFGGGLAPFAILFSLPFTIIGGLIGLLIAGETLSISSLIGALMLIGIVVTNAIVLIDRVIHKEKEGMSTREAILEAGGTRLRPILMTAIATIGALAPLAVGLEGSGLISKGLGVTVIGGLTSSTLLTLVIVPIVYEGLMKFKKKK
ncbi:efflux RND transporter permease subunit [Bacillus sp. DJP31]|uniref:efflux RND transporter permease subunit n=1 Tax=Bacillus sp. DJP31 TaxID=3409789 RepID=UPI003BB53FB7